MNQKQHEAKQRAQAKALLLTNTLRAAANAGITAQAQALLAILIAEAWMNGTRWTARLGVELLGRRLGGVSRHSIKRWTKELERAQLITRKVGNAGAVSRWTIKPPDSSWCASEQGAVHGRTPSGAPAHHAPVHGRTTDTDIRYETRDAPLPLTKGERSVSTEEDPASPQPRDDFPCLSVMLIKTARAGSALSLESIRSQAEQGNPEAQLLLVELEQPDPNTIENRTHITIGSA